MADFRVGDYDYTIINNNEVSVKVWDTSKTSYENLSESVVYNGITYFITSMSECFRSCINLNQPIEIPDSVTNISSCFYGCINLNQPIEIPDSVTNMYSCFAECTSLNQLIKIPDSVTRISFCFRKCTSLNQLIKIPNNVTNLAQCFRDCTSLNKLIEIPNGVTNMFSCFSGCTSLNQLIEIPDSVTDIKYCFSDCTSLNQPIEIPNSVTNILSCFSGCTNLNQPIKVSNNVTDMASCFRECINLNEPIEIPNGVTNMNYCFYGCTSLNQPIEIPNSVISMFSCFRECINLNQLIEIPNGITDMGSCFNRCTSLNQPIEIPDSVTNMNYCFSNCTSLSNNIIVKCNPENFNNTFESTSLDIYIINGTNPKDTTVTEKWRQIASQYSNVHFEVDDHPAPIINLSTTRADSSGQSSFDGTYVFIEKNTDISNDYLPYGYVTNITSILYLEGVSTPIDTTTNNQLLINLANYSSTINPEEQLFFKLEVSDGYKTSMTRTSITRILALLDFLGKQNPKSPYLDLPGLGMAIGTNAIRNGLDINFPTTIGKGLIPPTTYTLSKDTEVNSNKTYYTLNNNEYIEVSNPTGNPNTNRYYELAVDLNNYQLVVGKFNKANNDAVFIVGNGEENNRSNLMEVGNKVINIGNPEGSRTAISTNATEWYNSENELAGGIYFGETSATMHTNLIGEFDGTTATGITISSSDIVYGIGSEFNFKISGEVTENYTTSSHIGTYNIEQFYSDIVLDTYKPRPLIYTDTGDGTTTTFSLPDNTLGVTEANWMKGDQISNLYTYDENEQTVTFTEIPPEDAFILIGYFTDYYSPYHIKEFDVQLTNGSTVTTERFYITFEEDKLTFGFDEYEPHVLSPDPVSHLYTYDATVSFSYLIKGERVVFGENDNPEDIRAKSTTIKNQLRLGTFGTIDYNDVYALTLGNGTADNNRSDSLTIDWNGAIKTNGNVQTEGKVIANGNIETKGKIIAENHTTAIGTFSSKQLTTAKMTADLDSFKNGASLTLTPGSYIIFFYGSMSTSGTGVQKRQIRLYRVSPNAATLWTIRNVYPNGDWATLSATIPVVCTQATTLRVDASASVASTTGASTWILAMRIA